MSIDFGELGLCSGPRHPAGTVISYRELAERMGRPGAALAVANRP